MADEESSHRQGDEKEENVQEIVAKEISQAFEKAIPFIVQRVRENIIEIVDEKIDRMFAEKELKSKEKENSGDDGGHSDHRGDLEEVRKKGCTYKDFSSCNPPMFLGEADPLISMRWVMEVEGAFLTCKCADRDKVIYAANLLRNQAKSWWESVARVFPAYGIVSMSWEDFKKRFMEHFCPPSAVNKITREFLALQQGSKTVNEITNDFLDRASFCPDYVVNEKMKMDRFMSCLNQDIRDHVSTYNSSTFEDMVEAARRREVEVSNRTEEERKKRKVEYVQEPLKKQRFEKKDRSSGRKFDRKESSKTGYVTCGKCGKNHFGECKFGQLGCYSCGKSGHISSECPNPMKICYNCKEPGHIRNNCPKLPQNQKMLTGPKAPLLLQGGSSGKKEGSPKGRGRAFQITAGEARESNEVVSDLEVKSKGKEPLVL